MKYYAQLIKNLPLQEALNRSEKDTVDFWKRSTEDFPNVGKEASKDVMKGESTIYLPLHHHSDLNHEVPSDIHSHLQQHGFSIPSFNEYKGGYATDKHGRITTIGKAFNRTKAPDELRRKFENDPLRQTKTGHEDLRVAITHDPEHVAGASTDRGWTSCMDMKHGCQSNMLEKDIQHGTHAAYLIHKDDKNIENPIARISLKPFKNVSGHAILRPEHRTYGMGSSAFEKTVHDWSEKHFPMKGEGSTYQLHSDLYHDSDAIYHNHTPESAKKEAEEIKSTIENGILNRQSTSYQIQHAVNKHTIDPLLSSIKDHPDEEAIKHHVLNFTRDDYGHVANKTLDSMSPEQRDYAVGNVIPYWKQAKIKPEHIDHYIDSYTNLDNPKGLAQVRASNESHAEKIRSKIGTDEYVKHANNHSIESPKFVNKLIDTATEPSTVNSLSRRLGLSSENIHNIIDKHPKTVKNSFGVSQDLIGQNTFSREHMNKLEKIGAVDKQYRHMFSNVKGEDIPDNEMHLGLAKHILHHGGDANAMHKAMNFLDSDEQHWNRKITNVKSLGKHAIDDPTARDFLINHPSLHHTAIESMNTEDQDKVKLKSLTDPFVEPSKKLKHLSDLMKDENVPHSIKFAAADRVKGTDMEELAQNGLNRFKRKHYEEMSNE